MAKLETKKGNTRERDPIVRAFDALTARDGGAPLVASTARRMSRAEVADGSRAVARSIGATGAAHGSYVLVACVNGAGFLAAVLGARRAGCVPVLADGAAPGEEHLRLARSLGISLRISCDEVFPASAASLRVRALPVPPAGPPEGADYVKVTSGSTGAASGVAVGASALEADDDQLVSAMGLRGDDRILADIPWSHSYAFSSAVLPALRRGSLLVVSEAGGPWSSLDAGRALGATVFPTVPAYLHAIASLALPPAWPATIRTVVSAGSSLRPETAERFEEVFGRRAHVFYGASECGGITYDRAGDAALRGTVGVPIDGVSVDLGSDGTVRVRSAAVAIAYVPQAGERLSDGEFVTADLGTFTDAGELRLLGRADAVINVAGKKVHPAEVEIVLRAMPGVRDVVVLGVAAGAGGREVVRAVIACDRATTSYESVIAWCRARLAAHKIPRSVLLVDELPRTSRGKVDRAALSIHAPADALP